MINFIARTNPTRSNLTRLISERLIWQLMRRPSGRLGRPLCAGKLHRTVCLFVQLWLASAKQKTRTLNGSPVALLRNCNWRRVGFHHQRALILQLAPLQSSLGVRIAPTSEPACRRRRRRLRRRRCIK